MDNYFTAITLLGLRDQNLPPFKYEQFYTCWIKANQILVRLLLILFAVNIQHTVLPHSNRRRQPQAIIVSFYFYKSVPSIDSSILLLLDHFSRKKRSHRDNNK